MYPIFLGLFMLVTVSTQAVPPAPFIAGGQFKTMIECKDREIGVLMTLSQWIAPTGVASTIYRITTVGQKAPRYFNRPDDRDEQQLRKVFFAVCLQILSDPSILEDGVVQ